MSLFAVVVKTVTVHVATIHFVGLVLFTPPPSAITAKLTTNPAPEFVAIMPFVPSHIPPDSTPIATAIAVPDGSSHKSVSQPPASAGGAQSATRAPQITHETTFPANHPVEPHTAFLIFKDSDLLDVIGWEVKRFEPGYLGIQLTGEHLSFVSDAALQDVSTRLSLGRAGRAGAQLRPEYLPPDYSDAAAVFSIPNGQLAACAKGTNNPNSLTRIDTELKLNNSGQLTIRSGTKNLTVVGDAFVVAAHIPSAHAVHQDPFASPHYTVYCTMTGTSAGLCTLPMASLTDTANPKILQCYDNTMAMGGGPDSRVTLPVIPPSIDFF